MPTHAETRIVPYTREQMFQLVADVERYPEFLPWCVSCKIIGREGPNVITANLAIGFKMIRESFNSRVTLSAPDRIDVEYRNGPFRYLNNHWLFEVAPNGQCRIDFYIDFEFRSKVLQKLIGSLFNEAVQRMVGAFERRARMLHGRRIRHVPAPGPQVS